METRIRTPDVIHTNVEGFFQQLMTALVAATPKGTDEPPARGTKRWVTTARLRLHWLLNSTSVGTSSQSDDLRAPSLTPMKYQT